MPRLRLSQAARLAGVSRSTMDRALRSGRVSYETDERGERWIDPSEVARAFPDTARHAPRDVPRDAPGVPPDTGVEQELRARIALLEAEVSDLRRRLDATDEERRQLTTRLLPAPRRWWWWRR